MSNKKIGVGTFSVTTKMWQLVTQVLGSERISYGPMSRELESRFAEIHDSSFSVVSNSGTSSLHTALQTLKDAHGWQQGDEVITAACTFVATVNVILHNGLKPVLVDVEEEYYGINPELIEAAITDRTRAIIPVHLFGMPCDMEAIKTIADKHDLKIIEDSCESMFVKHCGKPVGSWGDIGCFSTYVAHLLTTGVGGLAITNNPDYAAKMRSLVNHGRDGIYISIDDDDQAVNSQLKEIVSRRFNFEAIGHSFRITELEAALGVAQLDDWESIIDARQNNAAILAGKLADLEEVGVLQLPKIRPYTEHAFMMYPIVVLKDDTKWGLCNYLEKHGVETREMLRITDQPAYSGMWDSEEYPVADWINRKGFYVGIHQDLSYEDLKYMAGVIYDYFDSNKV
jgi:dTDP-4-amino-4,6-dideoxygalactose transaminase